MKRTLLLLTFCVSFFTVTTVWAQDPYTLTVFDQAIYYGMYEATVDEPVPEGAIRNSNSSYGKMLTEEQLASFGNTLTMTVTLNPLCDNYDRIGNVNLVLVPKGQTSYVYGEVGRLEIGRFITPFMDKNVTDPDSVPYVYELNHLTKLFHNESITSNFDFWVELEVYGYQGGPGQGGAAVEIPGCQGRNDVYMGSLEFTSTYDDTIDDTDNYIKSLVYKYELKNYTLDGTDVLGETVKTINFTLEQDVPDVKLYLITSNHGSNNGGEEYIRRNHFVYFDDEQVLMYKPGGVSCAPFFEYNTQPSCIYYDCSTTPAYPRPDNDAAWSWNNWCPGDKIPIRIIELGDLSAGEHSFRIEVPDAQFADGQGYFPMSVYLQGAAPMLNTTNFEATTFSVSPNPVVDLVTINSTDGTMVKAVNVTNTLGQTVYTGTTATADFSQLQSGIYIIQATFANGNTATRKIVKK
ncbi:T9SS type A sorting domain-containing protein [Flavobacterium salilacus subsp. salilacus]|uniref:peptide-N-glycosidase F-related protein n=1 Tax=Flavobacterium TaxID=237 RepID=UPI0010754D6B|nr:MULTISPECIES: peptide-N-glycosidase F-related protein [Flavobacterium]KAF2519715.1 T9SS type A sorting domain-containing protein [Flavobacterium salilacus subsp. salilacus]MBE1614396.1 T9SS type A sorting domain-containing protein [Flavobacterium sp. SaA2.13]